MGEFLDTLAVMPAAFVMCLVLTGIHGYLGLHVLERKVIFVDLALAQIAALGGIYAMWLGYDPNHEVHGEHSMRLFALVGLEVSAPPDTVMVYGMSLGFALFGAGVFAVTRMREERVPHEAFIGVAFATAIAIALLFLERLGGGAEHVRNMLARDALLFTTWEEVGTTAALYLVIGGVHVVFRRRFAELTQDPDGAARRGVAVHWWDFLFYATFALVITSSVQIAGVLLVFSYLVVPAAIAVLFADGFRRRIWLAWGAGFVVSVIGMVVCAWDNVTPPGSPPGPWIVACFAAVLTVATVVRALGVSDSPLRLLRRVGLGASIVVALVGGSLLLQKVEMHRGESDENRSDDPIAEALEGSTATQLQALAEIREKSEARYVPNLVRLLDSDPEAAVVEETANVLGDLGDRSATAALVEAAERAEDPTLRVAIARAVGRFDRPRAAKLVADVLAGDDLAPFDRADAEALLEALGRANAP